jgi:hypothetical protein
MKSENSKIMIVVIIIDEVVFINSKSCILIDVNMVFKKYIFIKIHKTDDKRKV